MASFFIPEKFPGLNDYIKAERTHRMVAAAMKKKYTDLVTAFCIDNKIPKTKGPCAFTFEWHEANARRDPDNIVFAKKFVFDGLVNAKILVKDSQKYVLNWEESWVIDPKKVGVLVNIVEYEDD